MTSDGLARADNGMHRPKAKLRIMATPIGKAKVTSKGVQLSTQVFFFGSIRRSARIEQKGINSGRSAAATAAARQAPNDSPNANVQSAITKPVSIPAEDQAPSGAAAKSPIA